MADHTRVVVVTEALGAERTSANVFGPVANATLLGGAILWTSLGDLSRVRMRHSWATPLGQVVGEVRRISCVLHDLRSLRSVSAASWFLVASCTFYVCHERVGGNGTFQVALEEFMDFVLNFTDACVDHFRDGLSMHLLQIGALGIQHFIESFELRLHSTQSAHSATFCLLPFGIILQLLPFGTFRHGSARVGVKNSNL
jgi:hypothetical protein